MRLMIVVFICYMSLLISCSYKQGNLNNIEDNNALSPTETDSLLGIEPDYFVLTDEAFQQFLNKKNSGWFINKERNERLYFVPYTDHSITTAVLTQKNTLNKEVNELLLSEGVKVNDTQNAIEMTDFVSKKGIRLGVDTSFVIKKFGTPHFRSSEENIVSLSWMFRMKENETNGSGELTPFIHEGLEFEVKMEFEINQLITLVYKYGVP